MGPPWPGDQPRCRGGRLQRGRPPRRWTQPHAHRARQPWNPHLRRSDGRDGRRGAEPGVLDRRCGDPHRGGAARRSGSQPPAGPDHDPDGRSELLVDRALQVTTQPEPNGARHRSAPDLGRREFLLGAGAAAVAAWTAARASGALAGTGPRFQGVDEFAAAVFDWSEGDGGQEGYLTNFPPYDAPVGPGYWVPTPPDFLPALQPYWGMNRCLAIQGGAACPPGDHPPFSEDPGSAFHAEAAEVYEAVNNLTPEQEAIARFWSDDPGTTPTPPGHSIAITTQTLRHDEASLVVAAEAYAKVGIAVCDAFIACWYQKYVYNLLRPVTYIRRHIHPDWAPLLVTPPFPEYTSGHSVQSAAAFQVLTNLFGDGHAFVDHTHDDRGLDPRFFGSFLEAADEAAISRLYGGIHFNAAIVNGVTQGRCIGHHVSALPLRA